MKVEDIPLKQEIIEILKEHGINKLYPPQEKALPFVLEVKTLFFLFLLLVVKAL